MIYIDKTKAHSSLECKYVSQNDFIAIQYRPTDVEECGECSFKEICKWTHI